MQSWPLSVVRPGVDARSDQTISSCSLCENRKVSKWGLQQYPPHIYATLCTPIYMAEEHASRYWCICIRCIMSIGPLLYSLKDVTYLHCEDELAGYASSWFIIECIFPGECLRNGWIDPWLVRPFEELFFQSALDTHPKQPSALCNKNKSQIQAVTSIVFYIAPYHKWSEVCKIRGVFVLKRIKMKGLFWEGVQMKLLRFFSYAHTVCVHVEGLCW